MVLRQNSHEFCYGAVPIWQNLPKFPIVAADNTCVGRSAGSSLAAKKVKESPSSHNFSRAHREKTLRECHEARPPFFSELAVAPGMCGGLFQPGRLPDDRGRTDAPLGLLPEG